MKICADKAIWQKNCIIFGSEKGIFGTTFGTLGCFIPYKNVLAVDMDPNYITFIMIGGSEIRVEFKSRPDDKKSVEALSTFMQAWQSQYEFKQDDLLNI
jgi:hypothetical protein